MIVSTIGGLGLEVAIEVVVVDSSINFGECYVSLFLFDTTYLVYFSFQKSGNRVSISWLLSPAHDY